MCSKIKIFCLLAFNYYFASFFFFKYKINSYVLCSGVYRNRLESYEMFDFMKDGEN